MTRDLRSFLLETLQAMYVEVINASAVCWKLVSSVESFKCQTGAHRELWCASMLRSVHVNIQKLFRHSTKAAEDVSPFTNEESSMAGNKFHILVAGGCQGLAVKGSVLIAKCLDPSPTHCRYGTFRKLDANKPFISPAHITPSVRHKSMRHDP